MNQSIESFINRESVWPDHFDDRVIDDIIWSEIQDSPSAGDFAAYLVHRPQNAKYMQEARERYESIDESLDTEPLYYYRAIKRIEDLSDSGDASAMFHLGKIYSIGIGVEQNFQLAESWYLKAIELGEIRAHCNLGWLYQSGFGLVENKEKAFQLLSIGARHGIVVAKATVAVMLLSGEGCAADSTEALRLLEEAFDEGYNNAANCIADAYFAGTGVEPDIDLGFYWLARAADRGDERTMAILGHYLVSGSHGKTDVARGVAYLFGSANRGYPKACLWLGSLYEQGLGVEPNPHMASMLYRKGIAAGDEECEFALNRILSGATVQEGTPSIN